MNLKSMRRLCGIGAALVTKHQKQLLMKKPCPVMLQSLRNFHRRGTSTIAVHSEVPAGISEAVPTTSHSLKIIFSDHQACDFKHIWLRDNCKCPKCMHPDSKQKLVDTAGLDINIRPKSIDVGVDGTLEIVWPENGTDHKSNYSADWLYKYGRSFALDSFNTDAEHCNLPPMEHWDRVKIWKNMPEISYREVMETESGLKAWLEMMYKYGVAIMRNAPCNENEIVNIVNRFAYVKTTIWGQTFDVVCKPVQSDPNHQAFTGMYLEHHTDMNYREKSPGLQLLHCLKATDPQATGEDFGGKSFFVDGFYIADWLQENQPSAFHILSSTPIKFAIKSHSMTYSQTIPVICVDKDGELQEIHYNTRTMSPLQIPSHLVMPFYHAYRLFGNKMREPSSEFSFHMVPGDVVAFNNRRVLHGRTSFDPTKVNRYLKGCYVDIDEVFTRYRAMI